MPPHNPSSVLGRDSSGNAEEIRSTSNALWVTGPAGAAPALGAGETHIGEVGGNTFTISVALTVTAGAYTTGQLLGGKLTLANAARVAAGSGVIQSVVLVDQAKQSKATDVVFFNADPSGTTFTDNATLDVADADMAKIVGTAHVTDFTGFNDNSSGQAQNVGIGFDLASGTSLFACCVMRDSATFAATTDVNLLVTILRD